MKRPIIPVAWVQIGKAYVSYHLMGVSGNAKLCDTLSAKLKARMEGQTCFNFKAVRNRSAAASFACNPRREEGANLLGPFGRAIVQTASLWFTVAWPESHPTKRSYLIK
jgi:hypothetical protein